MRRRWLPLIVTAVGVTAGVSTAQQPPGYVTKALSGDIVDGAPLAGISLFVPPLLRNDEAYYVADLGAGGQALIAGDQVAVTTGMQIPNSPAGTEIAFLGQTAVSQNGDLTMSATLGGTAIDATNDAGVVEYNGTTNMIVQKGDPAPQTSDTYEFFGGLRRQQGDGLLFTSTLQPSGRQGLFARRDGVTKLVQQTGVTAPDGFVAENIAGHTKGRLLEDETENAFLALFFVVNFHPNLQQERVELIRNRPDDSNDVLIATDDAVPGLPAGTTFQGGFVPQLNDFGQVGMFIDYDGASTGRSLSVLELNGVVQSGRSVAKTGDPAPGAPGFQFTSFQNFVINQSGDVAFQGQLDVVPPGGGSGDLGPQNGIAPIVGNWYEGDDGQLALAAHNGMQAPGLDLGVTIEQVGFPALNDLSQIAFTSKLAGPGVDFFVNDEALWATNLSGDLQLVARTGDLFDVDDNPNSEDLRTISGIGLIANSGNTSGRIGSFNDSGQLAFALSFTDASSGLFLATFPRLNLAADRDGDDDVDGDDFLSIQRSAPSLIPAWESEYGAVTATMATQPIPEPAAIALIALCGGTFGRRGTRTEPSARPLE